MFRLYKSNGIDDVEIKDFDTEEQAVKKMNSLIKKEVKTVDYVRSWTENGETWYDYGMWNRFYKIKEVVDDIAIRN